jgi:hypothetical protein
MQLDPRCCRAVNLTKSLRLPGDPLVILTRKINMLYGHHEEEFSGKSRWRDDARGYFTVNVRSLHDPHA